jgi:hypothetical protein
MYDAFFLLREMIFQKFAVDSKEFLMYLQQNEMGRENVSQPMLIQTHTKYR